MDASFYQELADAALTAPTPGSDPGSGPGHAPAAVLDAQTARRILVDPQIDLLPLLNAAYTVRKRFCGNTVQVHILNNAQNGRCPEDCAYCTQARTSEADIEDYPIKSEEEILGEAQRAYEAGAHRYCMVFAGRGPNDKRTDVLADLVRKIKSRYPIEVCVSAGLLDEAKAQRLKEAGLDRLNHNLNTSRDRYARICTTHTYDDRLNTLHAAKKAGLETCSGLIVGMGEPPEDVVELAATLHEIGSASIPINFLLPFDGNVLNQPQGLSPQYCLRVLCLFRFMNPRAEIRCAAGREFHLRSLEVMCLYPANSIFLDGYLNGKGAERRRTYQMIRDAGFKIESDQPLDDLLHEIDADTASTPGSTATPGTGSVDAASGAATRAIDLTFDGRTVPLKTRRDLHPTRR